MPEAAELLQLMAERSDVKANEVRRACEILGVHDVYFFGADDAILLVNEETDPPSGQLYPPDQAGRYPHALSQRS